MSKVVGVLAEFASSGALLRAARRVRDAGYRKFDCHSPFPIHGMDEAMGLKRSIMGYVVGVGTVLGGIGGMTLQWWVATRAEPVIVAGKPLFSWQAFIIITFALFVLVGAFSAVFGFLKVAHLPRWHHPVFYSDRFEKFSTDGFFLSVEAEDPQFDQEKTKQLLIEAGAVNVEVLEAP